MGERTGRLIEQEVRLASPKGSTRLTSSLSNPNISTVKKSVNVYTIESTFVSKADLDLSSVAVVASWDPPGRSTVRSLVVAVNQVRRIQ